MLYLQPNGPQKGKVMSPFINSQAISSTLILATGKTDAQHQEQRTNTPTHVEELLESKI